MDSVANSIYLPPLEAPHERETVGYDLQMVLHELINLSLIGKQLHWTVVGAESRQAGAVTAGSQVTPVEQAALEDHVVVWEMTRRVAEVAERVRARLARVGQLDLASQDVLIDVVRRLEKQQWLLRVQLGERT